MIFNRTALCLKSVNSLISVRKHSYILMRNLDLKGYPDMIQDWHFWCHYFLWEKCLHPVYKTWSINRRMWYFTAPSQAGFCYLHREYSWGIVTGSMMMVMMMTLTRPIGFCNCFLDSHQCFEELSCARSDWWWRSLKSYWIPRIILWLIFNMGSFDTEDFNVFHLFFLITVFLITISLQNTLCQDLML